MVDSRLLAVEEPHLLLWAYLTKLCHNYVESLHGGLILEPCLLFLHYSADLLLNVADSYIGLYDLDYHLVIYSLLYMLRKSDLLSSWKHFNASELCLSLNQ